VSGFFLGSPIGESHLRDQMQKVIDEQGLPDVVFHVLFCFGYTNHGNLFYETVKVNYIELIRSILR